MNMRNTAPAHSACKGTFPQSRVLESQGLHSTDYLRIFAAAKLLQSCPTLCNPMDCSPPGSSVHGIFQARVLEWGAIAFSIRIFRGLRSSIRTSQMVLVVKNPSANTRNMRWGFNPWIRKISWRRARQPTPTHTHILN